jgi:hypothetical protein
MYIASPVRQQMWPSAFAAAATALVLAFASGTALAEPSEEMQRLVRELGSGDFAVRQRATAALGEAGADAIEPLAAAAASAEAEIRNRAQLILLGLARSPKKEARQRSLDSIRRLSRSADARVAFVAQVTLLRIREGASSSAAAELARLGATIWPVQSGPPLTFHVQLGTGWTGGDERLAILADLGNVPWLSLESAQVSDAALVHVGKLNESPPGLTKLFLGNSGITGSGLPALAPLTRLQYLSVKQLPIDDVRLAALPDFPELQYLGLDGTKVGDEGLKTVAKYTQLQTLWLDNTRVTDAGLGNLKPLVGLRTLYLPGTKTTGPGLVDLRHLPNLTSLSLKATKLAPDSLKHVAQLEQLESLGLDQTNVNDEQLADLAGLNRLRILWLSSTAVGDPGLEHLKSLRGLQIVHLTDTQVSAEGVAELQRALPNCQMTTSNRFEQKAPPAGQPRRPPSGR